MFNARRFSRRRLSAGGIADFPSAGVAFAASLPAWKDFF
jgi:hypothetical protein